MTDLDIWRSANILLKRYGGDAVFIASKRADALLDQGDHHGCSTWIRIAKAITQLERKQPGRDIVHWCPASGTLGCGSLIGIPDVAAASCSPAR